MEGSCASAISWRASSISLRKLFNSLRAALESRTPYCFSMDAAASLPAPCITCALVSMLTITRSRSSLSNSARLSARPSRTSQRPGTSGIRQSCWADRKSTRLNSIQSLHGALPIYADNHQIALVLIELGEVVGQAEQDLATSRDVRHQAELLGRSEEHTAELHSVPTRRSSDLC